MTIIDRPQFSLKHAAYMIGVSNRTVRRWAHSGRMNGFRVGGRRSWYFSLDQINKMRELYALPSLEIDEAIVLFESY